VVPRREEQAATSCRFPITMVTAIVSPGATVRMMAPTARSERRAPPRSPLPNEWPRGERRLPLGVGHRGGTSRATDHIGHDHDGENDSRGQHRRT
jgi:hypothetical protein